MKLHILGCGDAFGSGGRLNTAFFIETDIGILLDCGASVLPALKRCGLDGDRVDVIVLTHLLYGLGFWRGLFTKLKLPGGHPGVPVQLERM